MREIILVLGKTGSGKTTWIKNYCQNLTRVLIAECFGEYENLGSLYSNLDALLEYLSANNAGPFRVRYEPLSQEFPYLCNLAKCVGPVHFVLEEADRFDGPEINLDYDEIISRGRHWGISIIAASLYPYKLPALLRRQASRIICYRQHEPSDLRWLSDVFGPAAYEKIPNLMQYAYLDWSPEKVNQVAPDGATTPLTLI